MTQAEMHQTPPAHQPHDPVVALIPRVNIQAFCTSSATAQVMQQVGVDRRMSRAHFDIQHGGIMAAVQMYANASTPDVLILETQAQRDGVLSELGQLAQVCDPSTRVILIGHVNDVILYRELMRQGISDYMVAPVHQLQVIESVANLYHTPDAKPIGRVIAFVGAKGGVGSSTMAHNIAWLASRQYGLETVITDLDLAFGTAGLNFNQDTAQGIAEALGSSDRIDNTMIDRLLTKLGDKLSLLAAPASIERAVQVEKEALETIMDSIRSSVPVIVVDVPNIWAPWTRHVLVQADEVVITATPELASLRNCKNLVDHLRQARPNDAPPRLILNQVGVIKRPEIPVGEFTKAVGVEPIMVMPFDAQVFGTAASNGQMIVEVNAKSKPAELITQLAQLLIGREPQSKPSRFSLGDVIKKLPVLGKK